MAGCNYTGALEEGWYVSMTPQVTCEAHLSRYWGCGDDLYADSGMITP